MIQPDQTVTEKSPGTESTEEVTNPDWRVREVSQENEVESRKSEWG